MKIQEIKNLSNPELQSLLGEKRKELFHLRLKMAQGKAKDIKSIQKTKKDIARILTLITQQRIVTKGKKSKQASRS